MIEKKSIFCKLILVNTQKTKSGHLAEAGGGRCDPSLANGQSYSTSMSSHGQLTGTPLKPGVSSSGEGAVAALGHYRSS